MRAPVGPSHAQTIANDDADDRWNAHYQALLSYCIEHDHCNVPAGTIRDGLRLGQWLNGQRSRMRASIGRPIGMNATKEEKLRELVNAGKLWIDSPGRRDWDEAMDALERWAMATNGGVDFNCPHDLKYDDIRLGAWLTTQRMRHRAGEQARTPLKPEQRARMDALVAAGKLWLDKADTWESKFEAMLRWSERVTGGAHCNVPYDCQFDGYRLGIWLNTQRQRFRGNTTKNFKLSDAQRTKMQDLVDRKKLWITVPTDTWERKFDLLLAWGNEKHAGEHYNVAQQEEYHGVKLGAWLGTQRQRMIGKAGKSKPLTNEQRQALQGLIDAGKLKPTVHRAPKSPKRRAPKSSPTNNPMEPSTKRAKR